MRKHIRYISDLPIHYDLYDVFSDKKEYLNNIGTGGLSFRSSIFIESGMLISICIQFVKPVDGIVVWCKRIEDHFDVGVKFLDISGEFKVRMVDMVCYVEHYKKEVFNNEGRKLSGEEAALEWNKKYAKDFPS
ncbi:MAG: PilZ domain-containing protein [Candidatus Theseobacter exili]|nr:PilZ domain-containing protein [Candidatus Theseobacter exili]